MRKPKGTKEAIFVTTVAAGFFIGAPLVVDASETNLDPTELNIHQFNPNQVLRYGHTGYTVSKLQFELQKLNFYFDKIDGHFGPKTREAVRQFQALYNIKVNGIAGYETLLKLNEILEIPLPKSLSAGDVGPEVQLIQDKLKKLGYYSAKIDGSFGPITKKSVITYQEKHNIVANGIATEQTIDHIMKNINVKGPTIKTTKVKTVPKVETTNNDTSYPVNTNVISTAMNYLGIPYVWGGESPNGFDCSGFIHFVFAKHGMTIPRTVSDIWNFGSSIGKLSVGDIVFFQTYKPGPSHAGIYVGDGKFIHSSSSNGISISELSSNYWSTRYLGAKRIAQ